MSKDSKCFMSATKEIGGGGGGVGEGSRKFIPRTRHLATAPYSC